MKSSGRGNPTSRDLLFIWTLVNLVLGRCVIVRVDRSTLVFWVDRCTHVHYIDVWFFIQKFRIQVFIF
jgi:hypothetical protein